jgi:hypothetical protein
MPAERPAWMRLLLVCLMLALLGAVPSRAQEPQGPPPPSRGTGGTGADVHELLPGVGRIGAEVAVFGGASWNPYGIGQGAQFGGYIDLPLAKAPGGKLSYEIFVGLSRATSDPFVITDTVAFVANLAAGASRQAALQGPPAAPFPVTREIRQSLKLLHLSPFSLKYTLTRWDHVRLRPYLGAGLDFLVALTSEEPLRDESLVFTGTAPFDDPLIGGLIAQAPELTARGVPTGQGNLQLGGHLAGGLEVRVSKGLSLNLEYRFTAGEGGSKGRLHSAILALGFHF